MKIQLFAAGIHTGFAILMGVDGYMPGMFLNFALAALHLLLYRRANVKVQS